MPQSQIILKYLSAYGYIALVPLAMLEGPIIALVAGFMVYLGVFSFIPAYLIMLLGDFVPDSAYYAIGYYGKKDKLITKYDTKSKLISRHFGYIEKLWHGHTMKTMFVSKLAYGFSIPLLVTAGLVRLPYKKFIWQALIVTLFQYGLLMTIGYFLGQSYMSAAPYVKNIEIIIAVVAVLVIVLYFLIQRYFGKKISKIEEI